MSHRPSRVLIVTIALISAFTITQRTAFAVGPASVSVSPSAVSATVGDDVALDITVANVPPQPGLGGYDVIITWDPEILDLQSVADSGWLSGGDVFVYCSASKVAAIGTRAAAEAACNPVIALGSPRSTSAPQKLIQVVFHAKAPGTTSISLTGSDPPSSLINPSNGDIAATFTGGSVTVSAGAAAVAATETAVPPVTPTLPAGRTSTPAPSSTPAAAPSGATSPETAAPTSAVLISQTPSTKPTQGTLSKMEVPRTGSGGADHGGIAWWIPALTTAGAALLVTSGVTAFRWSRRRRS